MQKFITLLIGLAVTVGGYAYEPAASAIAQIGTAVTESEEFELDESELSEEEYPFTSDRTPNGIMKGKVTVVAKDGMLLRNLEERKAYPSKAPRKENSQGMEMTVNVADAGTLYELLGDNLDKVEILTVNGEINGDDFNTLWQAGYYGSLVELDLSDVQVDGDTIPSYAMFHIDDQVDFDRGHVYCLALRKLHLPNSVTNIGEMAFAYLINLVDLRLPASLITIEDAAFTDCYSLPSSTLIFPEGLEVIGEDAFYYCHNLSGEIVFPQSLRSLMGGTFYFCFLTKVTLPDNLERLGLFDFAGCCLTEVYVPDNCWLDPWGRQFYDNLYLTKAHLPEHSQIVPTNIFGHCWSLEQVNIPIDAVSIYNGAFKDCENIKEVNLPEGLLSIGEEAFLTCRLTELDLPSTLTEVGGVAFGQCNKVAMIRCRALIPPVCGPGNIQYPGACPFGDYEGNKYGINRDIPVYVPIGTKELYERSWGWDYFTNFIETDFSSGVDELPAEQNGADSEGLIYDLQGKPVSVPQAGQIYIHDGRKELIR